jgi:hypothetical protein
MSLTFNGDVLCLAGVRRLVLGRIVISLPTQLPSMWIKACGCWPLVLTCAILIVLSPQQPFGQNPDTGSSPLTVSQIVNQLIKRNDERAAALKSYRGRRLYRLDYVGFPTHLHAEMLVEMQYTAPAKKEFKIVSQSGEKWIIDHVLKRLLATEQEAVQGENWKRTALNNQNYNFSSETGGDDQCPYVLTVEPKVATKFLFRGRVWVNANDFAVCRIEAEPAKNPSIWIKRTHIHHVYRKIGDFWLPKENTSDSLIRLGGHATLTIEYQSFEILSARPLANINVEEVPDSAMNQR